MENLLSLRYFQYSTNPEQSKAWYGAGLFTLQNNSPRKLQEALKLSLLQKLTAL